LDHATVYEDFMRIWHILTVRTGAEFDVGDELRDRGVDPVIPYETHRWKMANGKARESQRALYRGYVFAGFRHIPNWPSIRRVDGVLGYLGTHETPAILSDAIIDDLRQVSVEVARANAEFASKRIIKEGRNARISVGAMRAHEVRVAKIVGNRAIVEIIGANRPVSIALADLEAA
jgi:transcription antitermination factor NusG